MPILNKNTSRLKDVLAAARFDFCMAMTEVKPATVDILGSSRRQVPMESLRSRPGGHIPSGGARGARFSAYLQSGVGCGEDMARMPK
jgi:hypothetical protein